MLREAQLENLILFLLMANPPASKTEFKTIKRQASNRYFDEDLGGGVSLRMMQIPGGSFVMGSPEDEQERQEREGPQHDVTVPPFFMGKYPVTQAQWRAVAAMEPVQRQLDLDPSEFKGADRPVEQVSWEEAVEFCQRLSRYVQPAGRNQPSRMYRLPSEAEWEYACRAGTTTPFHFGDTITTELANYCGTDDEIYSWPGSYGDGPTGEYRGLTTPVGYFEVTNAFGLSDMHGNVWEWCQDHRHYGYQRAPINGSAWINEPSGDMQARVQRGGSWTYHPSYCRSAFSGGGGPSDSSNFIGFRVVCVASRIYGKSSNQANYGGANFQNDISGANIGNFVNQMSAKASQSYNSVVSGVTIPEGTQEIQILLDELSQSYPSETILQKAQFADVAAAQAKADPTLKQRILSAIGAGTLAAIEETLTHPASAFFLEAVKDWQETQPSDNSEDV